MLDLIIQGDVDYISNILIEYGVDVSNLSDSSLTVIYEFHRLTWNLTRNTVIGISNYFTTNNKYRRYIEMEATRETHSVLRKLTYTDDIKYLLETLNNETEQLKINTTLNSIVCLVYIQRLLTNLSDSKTIHILNFGLNRFWEKDIIKIIGDDTGDIDLNKLMSLFKNIAIYMTNRLDPKEVYSTKERLEDCYITLNKLRKKNIKSYTKKAHLLNSYDIQYKLAVSIEFIVSILYIRLNIEDIDNGTLKRVIEVLNDYGLDSLEFKDYVYKIKNKSTRKLVVELRNRYRHITKEIMSDEQLIKRDKLELAAINYAIKTGEFTKYFRYRHNIE